MLERTLPVAPDRVWAAWTDPELLVQWFTPAPWKTVSADLDVRPGGRCITTMESPEGEQFPNAGCYLAGRTRAAARVHQRDDRGLPPGRRQRRRRLPFTGRIEITPDADGGTHYRAIAMHADKAGCRAATPRWASTRAGAPPLDQLVALMS